MHEKDGINANMGSTNIIQTKCNVYALCILLSGLMFRLDILKMRRKTMYRISKKFTKKAKIDKAFLNDSLCHLFKV